MKIKIKHNIKRDGCTLSGQILDCQFLDGAKRGDGVRYFNKDKKLFLVSIGKPELWISIIFIWGSHTKQDLNILFYTYPTEQAAQDMLDFINTFVEKDEAVKEETKEKRYMIVEVGGEKCPLLSSPVNEPWQCNIDGRRWKNIDCDNCPHGKTLEQIQEEVKKLQEAQ